MTLERYGVKFAGVLVFCGFVVRVETCIAVETCETLG